MTIFDRLASYNGYLLHSILLLAVTVHGFKPRFFRRHRHARANGTPRTWTENGFESYLSRRQLTPELPRVFFNTLASIKLNHESSSSSSDFQTYVFTLPYSRISSSSLTFFSTLPVIISWMTRVLLWRLLSSRHTLLVTSEWSTEQHIFVLPSSVPEQPFSGVKPRRLE